MTTERHCFKHQDWTNGINGKEAQAEEQTRRQSKSTHTEMLKQTCYILINNARTAQQTELTRRQSQSTEMQLTAVNEKKKQAQNHAIITTTS